MTSLPGRNAGEVTAAVAGFLEKYHAVREEVRRVMVGQETVIDATLTALLAGGHVLLEGVPGLGKTLLVKTLAQTLDLNFSRIQFTPDLMPADIMGTNMVMESVDGRRQFQFQPGPIFANLILADEINRATPKTQSALLEAMQEHHVTAGGASRALTEPFFVLATQNPIDQEGTYPLPEAQLDRFFFKVLVTYPSRNELLDILDRTTRNETPILERRMTREELIQFQKLIREVPVASHVRDYAVRLVLATHPGSSAALPVANQYLKFGSSPRGAQTLILAGKVRALTQDRFNVSLDDIAAHAMSALRHRLIVNFEGEAEGVTPDWILEQIIQQVPKETDPAGIPA